MGKRALLYPVRIANLAVENGCTEVWGTNTPVDCVAELY